MNHPHVVAVIPAKGRSRRIERKNLRLLEGLPLVTWTIRAALSCPALSRTYLSTESPEVARIGRSCGALVINRPQELARDPAEAQDVAVHAVRWMRANGVDPEVVVMLLPTSPFRTAEQIEHAVDWHHRTGQTVVSVTPRPEARHKWVGDGEAGLRFCAPEGERPLELNGAIWVDSPDRILEHGGYRVDGAMAHPLDRISGLDIDREEDWLLAEALAPRRLAEAVTT